jgi:hypothetical protein
MAGADRMAIEEVVYRPRRWVRSSSSNRPEQPNISPTNVSATSYTRSGLDLRGGVRAGADTGMPYECGREAAGEPDASSSSAAVVCSSAHDALAPRAKAAALRCLLRETRSAQPHG